MPLGVAVLGSTGSIGRSALAVVARHPDRFRIVALAAHQRVVELEAQVARFQPELAVLADAGRASECGGRLRGGRSALLEAAAHPRADVVINAMVGAAGLEATLAALGAGKRLALANKESLVAGGPLVLAALRQGGGELVPIDSEHSAILQCLAASGQTGMRRLILTASGGPFRNRSAVELESVTPAEALQHPTWEMGAKISIDSATLANKALEVIEGHFLFGMPYDAIEVVVHPQSIIHSMVELVDGSVLAQLGFPTMELPILYALTHPGRIPDAGTRSFDPLAAGTLSFEPIDGVRFPAFGLGLEAGRAGGTAPAVYNAANEVAVAGFLEGRIPFPAIARTIERALGAHDPVAVTSLEQVLAADQWARELSTRTIGA
ncbi:MAG TPA: 1-deoxy-D-xylulose-5-phosphate reductoisomerase [Longimicrobiales bacterium]|nr:1-deoxy-D-xylulose-5-phosphate reductoisomerase [Longimicrobiales bacterium]